MNFLVHVASTIAFVVLAFMDPQAHLYCVKTQYGSCQAWWLWTPHGDLNIPPRPRLAQDKGCD